AWAWAVGDVGAGAAACCRRLRRARRGGGRRAGGTAQAHPAWARAPQGGRAAGASGERGAHQGIQRRRNRRRRAVAQSWCSIGGRVMSAHVKTRVVDGVMEIVWARPEKKNALTSAMYQAAIEALARADRDEAVSAVLFLGEGDLFTAGNDMEDFLQSSLGAI